LVETPDPSGQCASHHPRKPLIDQLLIQVAPLQEGALDALVVEGVEDVGDVAAVEVGFVGVDDQGAGDGELFADVAAAGGALLGVAGGGVDAREADALAADDFEAEVDV